MAAFEPTEEQQRVLEHDPSRHGVILAGPGTGKSATVVALIDKLALQTRPVRVRLLTFTRAATGELAQKVSEHPAVAAERPSTIHSFAISVLLRNPGCADYPEPLRMADRWEEAKVLRPTLARRMGVGLRLIDKLLIEMEANWQSLAPERSDQIDSKTRARFLGTWNEHRRVFGYTLLAELPYLLRQALQDHPDLEGLDYNLLVVDEYQDLNACDIEVLRRVADRGCSVLAAGDDDQSIYSFRKAAPEGIRRFGEDYENSENYELSLSKRSAKRIVEWAKFVIEANPARPATRSSVVSDDSAPEGEAALLGFRDQAAEALGVARLIEHLVKDDQLAPHQILVLMRGDQHGHFSKPIKKHLEDAGLAISDPEIVKRELENDDNRKAIEVFRLMARPDDPLSWAALLTLTPQVGEALIDYLYELARSRRIPFGAAIKEAQKANWDGAPAVSAGRAKSMVDAVTSWLEQHPLPDEPPGEGWGHWLATMAGDDVVPALSEPLATILRDLDHVVELQNELGRYLGQIEPLGADLALARGDGIRFMSMMGSKGLTVEAVVLVGAEEGIIPRPTADLSEERRLLYVAMTRPRTRLVATWARRRYGPTARSGSPRVGTMRSSSSFFAGGPVGSVDGENFIKRRWPKE